MAQQREGWRASRSNSPALAFSPSKEKELAEREDRRVNLYKADHPSMGEDTDLLQLNVGGNLIAKLQLLCILMHRSLDTV